jgi:tRNA dimethylallyltransferase
MADDALPAAIVIVGPTGCGKSDLALRLARERPVELVSVDSAQVYRGMDIGTAKPTAAERAAVPHHLIDIRDPESSYSAGEFRADCLQLLAEIAARGRTPVLVGGTMMYFRALFKGIAGLPGANPSLRAQLDARAVRDGWPALHAELAQRDAASAGRIHPHDAQRIQRALEVLEVSGQPLDEHWQQAAPPAAFNHWTLCILEPVQRGVLHQRLANRLQAMVATGFAGEVAQLLARGTLNDASPALRLVGYRQFVAHCRGLASVDFATERALYATRQLAKRQLTWLRSSGLFPADARQLRVDPFDPVAMEQILPTLIKS